MMAAIDLSGRRRRSGEHDNPMLGHWGGGAGDSAALPGHLPGKGARMAALDLKPYGFCQKVELRGQIEEQCAVGNGLVILFGEWHGDYNMIRDNLIDSCALIKAGIVDCVGV